MKRHLHLKAVGAAVVWVVTTLGGAQADIVQPTYIGNDKAPVTNQLGRNVPGTILNPDGTAVWVEIREVGSAIRPPDPVTGEGNESFNPLLRASYMGHDVSVGQNTGTFSETLTTNRLKDGSNYFARVYDKGTPSASLYYANSVPFQDVPPAQRNQVALIDVVFQGWHLVSGEADLDSDGDRIPDAMEGELGTSAASKDTDGDGYNDYFEATHSEFVSPTEPNIPLDVLLSEVAPGERGVSWGANPGLAYRLEVRPQWVDEETYTELWSGTAAETNLQHNVESWMTTNSPKGFFRVVVP
jgi:hypothetical protein